MKVYERKIVNMSLIYFKDYKGGLEEEDLKEFLSCMGRLYNPQGLYVDKDKLQEEILRALEAEKAAGPAKNTAAY